MKRMELGLNNAIITGAFGLCTSTSGDLPRVNQQALRLQILFRGGLQNMINIKKFSLFSG